MSDYAEAVVAEVGRIVDESIRAEEMLLVDALQRQSFDRLDALVVVWDDRYPGVATVASTLPVPWVPEHARDRRLWPSTR